MTNDQKFVHFMGEVNTLLKTLDDLDGTQGVLYKEKSRNQRRQLKILLLQYRLFVPDSKQKKVKQTNLFSPSHYNHLAR